jgi:hypothetical protein
MIDAVVFMLNYIHFVSPQEMSGETLGKHFYQKLPKSTYFHHYGLLVKAHKYGKVPFFLNSSVVPLGFCMWVVEGAGGVGDRGREGWWV